MKQHIMSIAAIAAIFTTGASAFDTDMNGRLLKQEGTKYIRGDYRWDNANNLKASQNLRSAPAGQLGDALIYPAFYSDKGWESEFTVINTGNEAMVAKVVFYSRDNSKELKDFNIYLSAHDVFRATVKENKLIIKDSSFVFQAKTPERKNNVGYVYTDTPTDASKKNISEPIPEGAGYIAVYGMIQADNANTPNYSSNGEDITAYHKNHDKLWRDYRHIVDTCRAGDWRDGIQEGIYDQAGLIAPDINTSTTNCGTVRSTVRNRATDPVQTVHFKSPMRQLAGSITLKGNDSKGTRAMTLNAVPLTNFTDVEQGLLWTEGEFANIADRRIGQGTASTSNLPKYYGTEILADSRAFNSASSYKYEYGTAANNAFVLTQPHKRTLIQLVNNVGSGVATRQNSCIGNSDGDNIVSRANLSWSGIRRTNVGAKYCLITNYGAFTVTRTLYDDNEKRQVAAAGGFTFSPATVTAEVNTAPGEVTTISNIVSDNDKADGFTSGYATISIPVPGIATQMTANMVDGNAETNWIYSGRIQ